MKTIKKRIFLLFILLLLMLFLFKITYAVFEGPCAIRQTNCNAGETAILSVAPLPASNPSTNPVYSHASDDINEFGYKLCCPASGLTASCAVEGFPAGILRLSAEGQAAIGGSFSTPVCIDPGTIVQCSSFTGSCPINQLDPNDNYPYCILRLSGTEQAHVADCSYTSYTTAICCNTYYNTAGLDGHTAYCPSASQCGVGTELEGSKDPADYTCMEMGDYTTDNYCSFGTWKSRTHLIALQLFDLVDQELSSHALDYISNYTLYCDNMGNATNYYDYLDADKAYLQNNICVLDLNGARIIGMSFNIQQEAALNDAELANNVLKKLFINDQCDDTDDALDSSTADGNFHNCKGLDNDDQGSNLWYNKKLNSTVYGKFTDRHLSPIFDSAYPALNAYSSDINKTYLEGNISAIDNWMHTYMVYPAGDTQDDFRINRYLNLSKLNRIYFTKKGAKSIIGAIGEDVNIHKTFAVIKYQNIGMDICASAKPIITSSFTMQGGEGILCGYDSLDNTYYLFLQGATQRSYPHFTPNDVWQDLTSKLRIS